MESSGWIIALPLFVAGLLAFTTWVERVVLRDDVSATDGREPPTAVGVLSEDDLHGSAA